jgi:hypothetical protein
VIGSFCACDLVNDTLNSETVRNSKGVGSLYKPVSPPKFRVLPLLLIVKVESEYCSIEFYERTSLNIVGVTVISVEWRKYQRGLSLTVAYL